MGNRPAASMSELAFRVAAQHRRAVELGGAETSLELRERYVTFVENMNVAMHALDPGYLGLVVPEPEFVDVPCPTCGKMRSVLKYP